MHGANPPMQLDEVLPVLELLDQLTAGTFLPMAERVEDAVALEEPRDLGEVLLQARLRADCRHTTPGEARVPRRPPEVSVRVSRPPVPVSASEILQGPIQPDDDELVGIGLPRYPGAAE